jgi:hypothetical protein
MKEKCHYNFPQKESLIVDKKGRKIFLLEMLKKRYNDHHAV